MNNAAFDINGRFVSQDITGVQRHARALVAALDDLLDDDDDVRLLVPRGVNVLLSLRRIRTVQTGHLHGHAWEQIDLARAAAGRPLLSLCNTGPLAHRRHVPTIHDASVFAVPEAYSRRFGLWYRFLLPRLAARALRVLTDSAFSARELAHWLGLAPERLQVVHLGAEHLETTTIGSVPSVVPTDPRIPVVLLVASRSRHKNFAAAAAVAERLAGTGACFVAVGGVAGGVFGTTNVEPMDGILQLGYVDDPTLRALYGRARVLLYPSRYEGFGLPPLEAMREGCAVVTSDAASLPEVCGDAALYAGPEDIDGLAAAVRRVVESDALHEQLVRRGRRHAAEFRWSRAAGIVLDVMRSA